MSAFSRSHPAVNIMFFILVVVFAMLINHPVFIAISLLASLAYSVKLKGRSALKTFFTALLPLLLFVTALNAFSSHYGVTTLYTFSNGNNLTLEAIAYGAATGALVVNMMLWFICYNEVVTEDKFMHIFGKRFPHIALLILMVLRFVPLYSRQLKKVISSRKAAGISEGEGKIALIKNSLSAVSGVITWALEHSIETGDSMKSRGYGLKGRTSYSRFTFSPSDGALTGFIFAFSIIVAIGKFGGFADAIYNPAIEFSNFSLMMIISAVCYALLCFMPLIFEVTQVIKWNRLYAKI